MLRTVRANTKRTKGSRHLASLLMAVLIGLPIPVNARCDHSLLSVPADRVDAMQKGFNLTGWVDHPPGKNPRRPTLELLRKLAELGFTHVRLPARLELLLPTYQAQTAQAFVEVDAALRSLQEAGFA